MADHTKPPETVEVDEATVSCDGGKLGHPKVYLSLGEDGTVDCPYCDRRFVLEGTPAARGLSEAGAGDLPPPSDATVA